MPGNELQQPFLQMPDIKRVPANLTGKKILIVLPPSRFQDEEYQKSRMLLDETGAQVTVASLSLAPAHGMRGTMVTPDVAIRDANAADFDAVLLVGGTGSAALWHNVAVHSLVTESSQAGKVVAAICLAPVTLANAGLLEGKAATAYPSAREFLTWKGATYTGATVERAGNIITANGPEAAEEFAWALVRALR